MRLPRQGIKWPLAVGGAGGVVLAGSAVAVEVAVAAGPVVGSAGVVVAGSAAGVVDSDGDGDVLGEADESSPMPSRLPTPSMTPLMPPMIGFSAAEGDAGAQADAAGEGVFAL